MTCHSDHSCSCLRLLVIRDRLDDRGFITSGIFLMPSRATPRIFKNIHHCGPPMYSPSARRFDHSCTKDCGLKTVRVFVCISYGGHRMNVAKITDQSAASVSLEVSSSIFNSVSSKSLRNFSNSFEMMAREGKPLAPTRRTRCSV